MNDDVEASKDIDLKVLPGKMLDFLDAPVPFIVGVQHKPADWKMRTSNLVLINVVKDQRGPFQAQGERVSAGRRGFHL